MVQNLKTVKETTNSDLLKTIQMPKNLKNLGDRLPRAQYQKETYETGRKLTVDKQANPMPGSLEPKYILKESGNGG